MNSTCIIVQKTSQANMTGFDCFHCHRISGRFGCAGLGLLQGRSASDQQLVLLALPLATRPSDKTWASRVLLQADQQSMASESANEPENSAESCGRRHPGTCTIKCFLLKLHLQALPVECHLHPGTALRSCFWKPTFRRKLPGK